MHFNSSQSFVSYENGVVYFTVSAMSIHIAQPPKYRINIIFPPSRAFVQLARNRVLNNANYCTFGYIVMFLINIKAYDID